MAEMLDELRARIISLDGHRDTTAMLADATFLRRLVAALAEPYRGAEVTLVAGLEARGFALAAGVALELRAGFVPLRKPGGLLPGELETIETGANWRGMTTLLRIQRHAVSAGDRVLLVDDWAETGAGARAARQIVDRLATYVGVSLIVDELTDAVRAELEPVHALMRAADLVADAD